jgi:hypothetical protein
MLSQRDSDRSLAHLQAFFESTSHVYATMDTFRLGPIGFGASEQSYFSALLRWVLVLCPVHDAPAVYCST